MPSNNSPNCNMTRLTEYLDAKWFETLFNTFYEIQQNLAAAQADIFKIPRPEEGVMPIKEYNAYFELENREIMLIFDIEDSTYQIQKAVDYLQTNDLLRSAISIMADLKIRPS